MRAIARRGGGGGGGRLSFIISRGQTPWSILRRLNKGCDSVVGAHHSHKGRRWGAGWGVVAEKNRILWLRLSTRRWECWADDNNNSLILPTTNNTNNNNNDDDSNNNDNNDDTGNDNRE